MAVPVIVFLGCFIVGVAATTRWLPEIGGGPVGGLAFFAVCGLMAAALGLFGLGIEQTVRALESGSGDLGRSLVNIGLVSAARDASTLFGLAMVLYLLAPRIQHSPAAEKNHLE
jgi:hypothetical protein